MTVARPLIFAGVLLLGGADLEARAQADLAPQPEAEVAAFVGDAARGRDVYLRNSCQACHGTVGQGGGPGPILAASEMPYEAFAMQMREPSSSMPAYDEDLLTGQDLADILAYLRGLPGPSDTLPAILRD